MSTIDWNKTLRTQFRVPGFPGLYVLGCYARRVTLYSQQVRALNLIYGLFKTQALKKGEEVVVVGGGGAGLTAAAGAAFRGAKVTLLDELEGPMEIQQNNRQRWIHPYIYDWPYLDDSLFEQLKGGEASLPLLSWRADYAANVAQEICSQWDRLRSAYKIDSRWSVRNACLESNGGRRISLRWEESGVEQRREGARVILAVGFGLEPQKLGQDSYWAEDDLDGGFRKPAKRPRWLVSGSGDGALTDLMRLCVHRFRQDEMLNLFVTAQGIEKLKEDLRALHSDSQHLDEPSVSRRFADLSIDNELRNLVKEQLRRDGPRVVLVSREADLYGSKTSILNRLIVRILKETRPRAFQHFVGTTGEPLPSRDRKFFTVVINSAGKKRREQFHRVLVRHGPDSKIEGGFRNIHALCKNMASLWKQMPVEGDLTRKPNWKPRYFGPELKYLPLKAEQPGSVPSRMGLKTQDPNFAASVKRFGVYAQRVAIIKQVRSDGSSTVTYSIDGLSVLRGTISGIHFRYNSGAGKVDRIKVETEGRALKWEDDPERASLPSTAQPTQSQNASLDAIQEVRDEVRRLSGTVRLAQPLRPNEFLSFRLSFRLLNGDALSDWEYMQMYDRDKRAHLDKKYPSGAIEYLARTVWFPVRMFTIRIVLPTSVRECAPNLFIYPDHAKLSRRDVLKGSVLKFTRPPKWNTVMKAVAKPLRPPFDMGFFRKVSAHGWELSVPVPLVGSAYSLDWPLPATPENDFTRELERDARHLRQALLRYQKKRRDVSPQESLTPQKLQLVRQLFKDFYDSVVDEKIPRRDRFVVSLLAYREEKRRLEVVDGVLNGRDLDSWTQGFWLPFGLGMAGSCFKDGDRVFLLNRGRKEEQKGVRQGLESDPGFYLHIPHRPRPSFLLQIPIDHPKFSSKQCPAGYATSRQLIGIVSISSLTGKTWLASIRNPEDFRSVQRWCQGFCNEVYKILLGKEEPPA